MEGSPSPWGEWAARSSIAKAIPRDAFSEVSCTTTTIQVHCVPPRTTSP